MPTNTPGGKVVPQNTGPDAVWGCSPGYNCDPPKPAGCNIWANPPDTNYLCDAKNCKPSPDFHPVQWPDNTTTFYPPTKGYFNLNPRAFGLDYTIFVEKIIVKTITKHGYPFVTTLTTGDWASKPAFSHFATAAPVSKRAVQERAIIAKRDGTIIPAVCFDNCNNCFVEAQKVGKSPALCDPNAPFQQDLAGCQDCVSANGDQTKSTLQTYFNPEIAQFVNFCSVQPPQSVLEPATSTAVVVPVPATQTTVVATQTAETPTVQVSITSQAQASANTNTAPSPIGGTPVPTSSAEGGETSRPAPSPTVGGGGTESTSAPPEQVTGASSHLLPSTFLFLASVLILSIFTLF